MWIRVIGATLGQIWPNSIIAYSLAGHESQPEPSAKWTMMIGIIFD